MLEMNETNMMTSMNMNKRAIMINELLSQWLVVVQERFVEQVYRTEEQIRMLEHTAPRKYRIIFMFNNRC
jgi:hypothetical protein